MNNLDPRLLIAGGVAAVIFFGAMIFQAISSDDEEPETPPATDGPAQTLPSNQAVDDDDGELPVDDAEPGADIPKNVAALQAEVATDFVTEYFSISYRDGHPNGFLKRARTYMTTAFINSTQDAFKHDDPELSVEWSNIINERRTVSVDVSEAKPDPWYESTAKDAVYAVTYTASTQDATGTGGVGEEQVRRVRVVEQGGKYLVDEIVFTNTGNG